MSYNYRKPTPSDDFIAFMFSGAPLAFCAICLFVGFIFAKLHTEPTTIRALKLHWYRYVNIEKFTAIPRDTLVSVMPSDAYEIRRYDHTYYVQKTCKMDLGDVSIPYECGHSVTEKRARYYINRWVYDHTLENRGTPKDERQYLTFVPSGKEELGALREQNRGENLYVDFKAPFGIISYMTQDYNVWKTYLPEHYYMVEVNHLNEVKWETIKYKSQNDSAH